MKDFFINTDKYCCQKEDANEVKELVRNELKIAVYYKGNLIYSQDHRAIRFYSQDESVRRFMEAYAKVVENAK